MSNEKENLDNNLGVEKSFSQIISETLDKKYKEDFEKLSPDLKEKVLKINQYSFSIREKMNEPLKNLKKMMSQVADNSSVGISIEKIRSGASNEISYLYEEVIKDIINLLSSTSENISFLLDYISKDNQNNKVLVKWKKLNQNAIIPKYQTDGSAGFDIHALIDTESIIIPSMCQNIIKTGLSVAVPEGYEMQIRPRSGLSFKNKITITNSPGTLDSDYRGELMCILFNLGTEDFVVKNGDRIAQGKIAIVPKVEFIEVEDLDETSRNTGGFGSTGI